MNSTIIDASSATEPGKILHRTRDSDCVITRDGQAYLATLPPEDAAVLVAQWHDGEDRTCNVASWEATE